MPDFTSNTYQMKRKIFIVYSPILLHISRDTHYLPFTIFFCKQGVNRPAGLV